MKNEMTARGITEEEIKGLRFVGHEFQMSQTNSGVALFNPSYVRFRFGYGCGDQT
jgi:hypothetical protein